MKRKRIMAAATAAACSAVMLSAMPFQSVLATTLVQNDFEVTYGGWYAESPEWTAQVTAIENIGFNGSRGMRVTGRTTPADGAVSEKDLYLTGGKSYKYSVRVSAETAQTFTLTLTTENPETGEKTVKILDSKEVPAGQWTELSATYKAPKDSISFKLSITTDTTDDFCFDEVTVTGKEDITATAAEQGIKDELVNFGIRSGNILNGGTINDSTIKSILLKDCNAIECENETKPDATLVASGSTDTNIQVRDSSFAKIADWCAQNNLGFRGHTMVWHSQTPEWFFKDNFQNGGNWVSKATMEKRLESYIKNMFNLYKTKYPSLNLYAYDIANECMNDSNGGPRQGGYGNGASPWVKVYGDNSFLDSAFKYARMYAPSTCKLFYNDYNEYAGFKRDAILTMAKRIKAAGNLDGVGMQSHINANWNDGWSGQNAYVTAMKMYLQAGLEVQITELDISTDGGKYSLDDQARRYAGILKEAVDWNSDPSHQARVTLFQVWGPNDRNSWVATNNQGQSNAPLLYDGSNQPKKAYQSVIDVVPKSQWGDGTKFDDGFVVKDPEPDPDGNWFHYTFENGIEGFSGRAGSETLTSSGSAAYAGSKSLSVTDRTAAWHGAAVAIPANVFKAGEKFSFSAAVQLASGSSETVHFTMQYKDSEGETQYIKIDSQTATKGEWVQLANTAFEIPAGASDCVIYVECDGETASYFIDEVIGAPEGKKIEGPGPGKKLILGDVDCDGTITAKDLTLQKAGMKSGKFAGTIEELAADVDQSGEIDATDVSLLQQYLLTKITEFPVAERKVDFTKMEQLFASVKPASSPKKDNENNPLYTQRFGADPGWMVYGDRLYVYTTADAFEYSNGQMKENSYASGAINCISTADLVNWTDHGQIPVARTNVKNPIAGWANNAWAPDAAWKKINGQDKFFLYFANNGSGIGVITADDPTFKKNVKDPIGKELISRSTPNSNVTWLFDPGVYYDAETDTGIIAYGGGVPEGQAAMTKQGRIAKLGSDMISIVGTPIDPGTPYLFEDSSMIKIGRNWVYSFCHNWSVPGGTSVNGHSFGNADIGYMTSTDPLSGYNYQGVVFKNTGTQRLDNGGNNHHSIIEFKGNYYVLYHSRQLEMRMGANGGKGYNYRSPCIDKATVNGTSISCSGSQTGVSQIEALNPYETVQAETFAQLGAATTLSSSQMTNVQISGQGDTVVKGLKTGDWTKVKGVDFGSTGSKSMTVKVSSANGGAIKVCTGSASGEAFTYVDIPAGTNGAEITVPTLKVTGQKDVCFVFSGDVEFDYWKLNK
ncbi:MAG: endo-1,4-beta-xylanase [Oscillospiraceae bacterium]|nr:endo-1,4-beta-xylanase [Oscillospiraceae bacterium]